MKNRITIGIMIALCTLSMACGTKTDDTDKTEATEQVSEEKEKASEEKNKETKIEVQSDYASYDEIFDAIDKDTAATIQTIKDNYTSLKENIDTYDKYVDKADDVKSFFDSIDKEMKNLYDAYDKYYEAYFKMAIDTSADNKEFDKALDGFYDRVYNDAFDDIYDDVYNRVFDNYYDDFYNGFLDDARDTVAYNEWSDVHSQCYTDYSDAHSSMYKAYSDAHAKCYIIYSNVRQQVMYEGEKDYAKIMEKVKAELDEREATEKRRSEEVDYTVEYEVRDGKAYVTGISGEGNHATISADYEDCDVIGIDASAFEGSDILSVLCWADIEIIGDSAFKDCTELLEFSVPNETKVIGNHAFENCKNLKDLIIWGDPDIGDSAFKNCTSITEISFGSDTKCICDHAFDGCSSLESVIVWNNDTKIGKDAFANCPKLEDKPKESGESVQLEGYEKSSDKSVSSDDNQKTDGIRPEFQKAMDEYVKFFEEYCDFMKKYKETSDTTKMLKEYNDYMKQYVETMEALEDMDTSDMSKEEEKLYLDTMNKVNKMLLDAM